MPSARGPRRWYSSAVRMRTLSAWCSQGSAAATAAALSAVPVPAMETGGGVVGGAAAVEQHGMQGVGGGDFLLGLGVRDDGEVVEAGLLGDDVLLAAGDGAEGEGGALGLGGGVGVGGEGDVAAGDEALEQG